MGTGRGVGRVGALSERRLSDRSAARRADGPGDSMTDEQRRVCLSRRTLVGLGALSVATLLAGLGVSWWRSPSLSWTCGADDDSGTCLTSSKLDVDALGLVDSDRAGATFDVTPDGRRIIMDIAGYATTGSAPAGTSRTDRVVVAEFDADSGSLMRDLPIESGSSSGASSGPVAVSPDGSRVAAVTSADLARVEVISLDTGAVLSTPTSNRDDTIICSQVGMSPANDVIQCDSGLIDATDGTRLPLTDGSTPYMDRYEWSRTGIVAETSGMGSSRSTVSIGTPVVAGGDPAETITEFPLRSTKLDDAKAEELSFHPDERYLLDRFTTHGWRWWSVDGPRRSFPGTEWVLYDIDSGEPVLDGLWGPAAQDVVWSDNGMLALIDDHFEVAVVDFTALS